MHLPRKRMGAVNSVLRKSLLDMLMCILQLILWPVLSVHTFLCLSLCSPKGPSMCSCRGFVLPPHSLGCHNILDVLLCRSGHPYGSPQAPWSVISGSVMAASLPGWALLLQLSVLLRQQTVGHSLVLQHPSCRVEMS